MIELITLLSLQANSPYNWQMSCEQFLEAKQRIVLDKHFDNDTKTNMINYFRSKLNQPCTDAITFVP